jgi:predicted TIM-barrel fold metal-dependent hydrolase
VYAQHVAGGPPAAADYKQLQDFLFRYITGQAGQRGLVVHIHTGGGCGTYFDVRGSDPTLLTSVLNDPSLRQTTFVMLHGGSPFERQLSALIMKPNAWVDTSVLELIFSSAEVARIIRPWLETMPEHVMFGTDAGPFGPGMGWEETTWIGSRHIRRALAVALTQMVREGAVSFARAKEIADRVLRTNAAELYGLFQKPVTASIR